ncbi:hypothetical protein Plhal703r1_c26g0107031 [Plasmopara halstedii]
MARTGFESLRTASHVLSWLLRGRSEELPVDRVLEAIRSIYGVVPLGGRVGGADGSTPPATPKNAALTLFSAAKDSHAAENSAQDQSEEKLWSTLLSSVQLPVSGNQEDVRNALETLQNQQKRQTPLDIENLRRQFFAARRDYFAVRVELLRAARNPQHPNAHAAGEVVDELLKEGLREVLLEEVHGRQFVYSPSLVGVEIAERNALKEWEVQFLTEEKLLRELLLLTLVASHEKASLESAIKIAKTVFTWEVRVFDDVITSSTLAITDVQEIARDLTQIGVIIAVRLLHTIEDVQDCTVMLHVTKTFFLSELNRDSYRDNITSPVPGVLLLAWATLLGRHYRKLMMLHGNTEQVKELQIMLQETLTAAERLHGFHYLNALLQSLIFRNHAESDSIAMLHPLSLHVKNVWELPTVAVLSVRTQTTTTHYQNICSHNRVYQHVVATFLNDMLSTLRFLDELSGVQELHAMIKFVLPVLSNADVAKRTLGIDVEDGEILGVVTGDNFVLGDLLVKARTNLPGTLLSCLEMLTALCCQYQDVSSSTVLRQVLKIFTHPNPGFTGDATRRVCRPVPPAEYYKNLANESESVQCTRSFAYEDGDGRSVVVVGTIGTLVHTNSGIQVEWDLTDSNDSPKVLSLWILLLIRTETFATIVQSTSFDEVFRTDLELISILKAFFEFIVHLGPEESGGHFALEEMQRSWGEARLLRWWTKYQLSSRELYVPLLVRQQVTLPRLLSASSENLVSWGVRDRYVRQQILAHFEDCKRYDADSVGDVSTLNVFAVDGGIHLLHFLLNVLDGFLKASSGGESESGTAPYIHFVKTCFLAFQTLLASTFGVKLLMTSLLDGGQAECVHLIVKTARKLFEVQERLVGVYSVVLATLEIFISVVRWFLAKEAQALSNSGPITESFVAMERLWFVKGAEFAIEVLSIHESWKFVSVGERCEVSERCIRLLYVLVHPRKYFHEQNEMILALEQALCDSLSTDMSLVAKVLRYCYASVSRLAKHSIDNWNSAATPDADTGLKAEKYLSLIYESTAGNCEANIFQHESLVITCLRIIELLLASKMDRDDVAAARKILLLPINGLNLDLSLTLVTLCGCYLEFYVDDSPDIVYWSLRILQHSAVALDCRVEYETTSMPSLFALFYECQDIVCVRSRFIQLLQASSPQHLAIRKEVIELLALCLEHQPNFLTLLVFGSESDTNKVENSLSFLTVLTQQFDVSERLLEQSSDFLCALLAFLANVWEGAVNEGHCLHMKIITALRALPTFWPNVTRVLKIHMPLDSVEYGLLDMELAVATAQGLGDVKSLSSLYVGRSSAYGYLARGLILQLISLEWHNEASTQSDHPLVKVLESFRKEGLYLHWLRSLTRLDYSPTLLKQQMSSIRRICTANKPITNFLSALPIGEIQKYAEGLICDERTLKWQLSAGGELNIETCPADIRAIKLIQWGNLQAAYLHAQLFSLAKWKEFMEMCCLQAGAPLNTNEKPLSRKMSMISSPRSITSNASIIEAVKPASPASSSKNEFSRFFGDRTSFELIQVVADVIKSRMQQHQVNNDPLDYFVMVHLQILVKLLVSMLHHQMCLVLCKTCDPKLSQTRQRLKVHGTDSSLRFDTKTTLELLTVIERTTAAVHDSKEQITSEFEVVRIGSKSKTTFESLMAVSVFCRLVKDLENKVESLLTDLFTSLFTAALMLIRHLNEMPNKVTDQNSEMVSVSLPEPLFQAKFIGHSTRVITSCNDWKSSSQVLCQLSCFLLIEVLDRVGNLGTRKLKLLLGNEADLTPFVKELEHQQGITTLLHLLMQSFRPALYTKDVAARQEDACYVLHGLVAIVWNSSNAELCRRVMLQDGNTRVSNWLFILLATKLLPLLQAQMIREESNTNLRGYVSSDDQMTEEFNRSMAHRMWCLVLDFVGGLLRLSRNVDANDASVWEFLSYAEPLILAGVESANSRRLTRAVIAEHQALLRFLNGLSGSAWRRQRWRQAFPTSLVVLMEQCRQFLRRACVLLGNSSSEIPRKRKDVSPMKTKALGRAVVGFLPPKSPRSPRSPSAFTLVRQTLLLEHLQAVSEIEKQELTQFYQEMEAELLETVQLSSLLFVKWTASLTESVAVVVVNGVRHVDEEQLVPLLEFIPPSDAQSMNSRLGLGHLCLAMDFMLDQLEMANDLSKRSMVANAINVSALLFMKTYLLHAELYELVKRDCDELKTFIRQLRDRVSEIDAAEIDAQLFEHISKQIIAA